MDGGVMALAKIVQEARSKSGLSLREFASLCVDPRTKTSLVHATVNRIESGKLTNVPDYTTLIQLSENPYINFSPEELAAIADGRSPEIREFYRAEEALLAIAQMPADEKIKLLMLLLKALPDKDLQKMFVRQAIDLL